MDKEPNKVQFVSKIVYDRIDNILIRTCGQLYIDYNGETYFVVSVRKLCVGRKSILKQ